MSIIDAVEGEIWIVKVSPNLVFWPHIESEAIEQVKEEDCTQYGNEWLSNQVHVQEQNYKQFQRCCANMTEEQQQEEQGHDQQLSPGHVPDLSCCQAVAVRQLLSQ